MFAKPGDTYIPEFPDRPESADIDYVREHGKLVTIPGEDGVALVQWSKGLTVGFCRCVVEDGKIVRFAPMRVNRYVRFCRERDSADRKKEQGK